MLRFKIFKWFFVYIMELFKFVGNIFCNRYWLVVNIIYKKMSVIKICFDFNLKLFGEV